MCYNTIVTQVNMSILGKLYFGKKCFLFLLIPKMDLSLCDNNKGFTFTVCLLLGHIFFILGGRTMALIRCIECGNEISNKANTCPYCGCPLYEMNPIGVVKIKLPKTE